MKKSITLLILLASVITCINGQEDRPTMFDRLYQMDTNPVLKIQTDVKNLLKKKMKEEYQSGLLTINEGSEDAMEMDIKLRVRGNMRKRQCKLPPLKIDFDKDDLVELGLDSIDKLKLVLQCRNTSDNVDYLIKERLIYDLYALIDTLHIQSKLIEVELWKGDKKELDLQGFIVEDEEQYGKRINAKIIESGNVRSGSLQRSHYMKMIFFQYMIANTDWAIPNKHNVEMVGHPSYQRILAVPYDFDYSGFVGTPYAVPHETMPIKSVKERHFRGFQVTEGESLATAEFFIAREQDFYNVIENCSYCNENVKKESRQFIEPFFSLIKNKRKVKSNMVTFK